MSDTVERVKAATAKLLKKDVAAIDGDARFVEDLGADSMQSIELIAALEEAFDIEMDEDEALGVKTIADAAAFIDRVIAEA